MINLLSPDDLKQIRSARFNVRLRRYLILSVIAMAVIAGVYGIGYTFARNEYFVAQERNAAAQKDLAQYQDVKNEAAMFRANLSVAKKILGSEIIFSEFITDIAKTLPPNSVLANLTLSTNMTAAGSKTKGSTQITARAKSYNDVIAIKSAFEKSSLLSDVRIMSTSVASGNRLSGIEANYPYEVTFSLVINELGSGK